MADTLELVISPAARQDLREIYQLEVGRNDGSPQPRGSVHPAHRSLSGVEANRPPAWAPLASTPLSQWRPRLAALNKRPCYQRDQPIEPTSYQFSPRTWGQAQSADSLAQIKEQVWMLTTQPYMGCERPDLAPSLRGMPVKSHILFWRWVGMMGRPNPAGLSIEPTVR